MTSTVALRDAFLSPPPPTLAAERATPASLAVLSSATDGPTAGTALALACAAPVAVVALWTDHPPRGDSGVHGDHSSRDNSGVGGDHSPRGDSGVRGAVRGDHSLRGDSGASGAVHGDHSLGGDSGARGAAHGDHSPRGDSGASSAVHGDHSLRGDSGVRGAVHGDHSPRGDSAVRGFALRPARRLAERLAARGLAAVPRGRLVVVALPAEPDAARAAAERARAASGEVPFVLVVAGPRPAGFDALLAAADRLVVVPPPGAPVGLEPLAVAAAARLARATCVLRLPPTTPTTRLIAATGLVLPPGLRRLATAALTDA